MKLIEKKCPNCGAALEFEENDKSCKCQYCKRSFEIERDTDNFDKFNLIYDKIQKPFKIMFFVPFIFAFIIILIIIISIFSFHNRTDNDTSENEKNPVEDFLEKQEKLIVDASELTNENLDILNSKCYSFVHQSVTGRNDTTYSYQITGIPKVKKIFVASKEGENSIVSIYEVIYHNFFNQKDQQTVYVPVVFENVEKNIFFSLSNGKNPAPEYYLNQDHSSYIYAYGNFDDAYNATVKPLEAEYTISEK